MFNVILDYTFFGLRLTIPQIMTIYETLVIEGHHPDWFHIQNVYVKMGIVLVNVIAIIGIIGMFHKSYIAFPQIRKRACNIVFGYSIWTLQLFSLVQCIRNRNIPEDELQSRLVREFRVLSKQLPPHMDVETIIYWNIVVVFLITVIYIWMDHGRGIDVHIQVLEEIDNIQMMMVLRPIVVLKSFCLLTLPVRFLYEKGREGTNIPMDEFERIMLRGSDIIAAQGIPHNMFEGTQRVYLDIINLVLTKRCFIIVLVISFASLSLRSLLFLVTDDNYMGCTSTNIAERVAYAASIGIFQYIIMTLCSQGNDLSLALVSKQLYDDVQLFSIQALTPSWSYLDGKARFIFRIINSIFFPDTFDDPIRPIETILCWVKAEARFMTIQTYLEGFILGFDIQVTIRNINVFVRLSIIFGVACLLFSVTVSTVFVMATLPLRFFDKGDEYSSWFLFKSFFSFNVRSLADIIGGYLERKGYSDFISNQFYSICFAAASSTFLSVNSWLHMMNSIFVHGFARNNSRIDRLREIYTTVTTATILIPTSTMISLWMITSFLSFIYNMVRAIGGDYLTLSKVLELIAIALISGLYAFFSRRRERAG